MNLSGVEAKAVGGTHSLALLGSGRGKSWGWNYYGQLGNGTSGADSASDIPVSVKNLSNVGSIDGGDGFTLAATQ